jgi:hypothetical protein
VDVPVEERPEERVALRAGRVGEHDRRVEVGDEAVGERPEEHVVQEVVDARPHDHEISPGRRRRDCRDGVVVDEDPAPGRSRAELLEPFEGGAGVGDAGVDSGREPTATVIDSAKSCRNV